jgi:hypothetical protein
MSLNNHFVVVKFFIVAKNIFREEEIFYQNFFHLSKKIAKNVMVLGLSIQYFKIYLPSWLQRF